MVAGLIFGAPVLLAQRSNASANSSKPEPSTAAGDGDALRLAQAQGRADTALVDWVLANSGPLHGDTLAGAYRIAFTVTPAEGWWDKSGDKAGGGKLAWHDAPANKFHLRIFVLSRADGRLVPNLSLRATLIDANGNRQATPVAFGWYPLVNAYGGNVPLVADSSYSLHVAIDADSSLTPHPVPPPSLEERITRTTLAEFQPVPIAQDAVSHLPLATAIDAANEADLLKPANAALSDAITTLWQRSASGAEKAAGDYFVAYAFDDTAPTSSNLKKHHTKNLFDFSAEENVRLEVLIRDSRTGRFLPELQPQAALVAADGNRYGSGELPPLWHPWLNLYGRSVRIPRKGVYRLLVSFDAPGFRRWGRQSERFASAAEVEFEELSLNPQQIKPEGEPKP